VPKWCKTIVAVLLLPACVGALSTLWLVLRASGKADTIWAAALAGAGCWLAIYLLLPKPMWVYVFGHELTHALWTWLLGGRVKKFKASAKGGHVLVTRNNFVVALAPYFFPLYAALIVLVFVAGHWLWNWRPYIVWFHLLLGAAYAFHLTLTWHILKSRQSDITEHGYLFSGVIIFLGNIAVLLVGIPLLAAQVGVLQALGWWLQCTAQVLHGLGRSL
jgi:hypothetical protein